MQLLKFHKQFFYFILNVGLLSQKYDLVMILCYFD